MYAKFEEKTYETYMNFELCDKLRIYSPGQSEESILGIDAVIFSRNPDFWKLWIKPSIPTGDDLRKEMWDLDEKTFESLDLPKFKCNVFVQYKRPEYIYRSNGKEYSFWEKDYYRYKITKKQQNILCNLEKNISSNSVVVYACPACWKKSDLTNFFVNSELINNSNFVQPRFLEGHERFTFINSGNHGIAFSEPSHIENLDILSTIIEKINTNQSFDSNADFIYSLNESIIGVIEKFDDDSKEAFSLLSQKIVIPDNELAKSFKNILLFTIVTNTSWFIGMQHHYPRFR